MNTAYEVGREIAKRDIVLVSGGMSGVMEAACRGAKTEGGLTVGIIPGTEKSEANPYVDIPVVTGMGHGRNIIVVRSSDAIIAIGGSYGTLSEIAFA
ncbi:MAG: TIGR00725 family protein, partial [Candidatus Aenigmarchaeota archaeon]|nr:TIGR00725 family protein [Candidatus Aenigmarchaeota archaeon]